MCPRRHIAVSSARSLALDGRGARAAPRAAGKAHLEPCTLRAIGRSWIPDRAAYHKTCTIENLIARAKGVTSSHSGDSGDGPLPGLGLASVITFSSGPRLHLRENHALYFSTPPCSPSSRNDAHARGSLHAHNPSSRSIRASRPASLCHRPCVRTPWWLETTTLRFRLKLHHRPRRAKGRTVRSRRAGPPPVPALRRSFWIRGRLCPCTPTIARPGSGYSPGLRPHHRRRRVLLDRYDALSCRATRWLRSRRDGVCDLAESPRGRSRSPSSFVDFDESSRSRTALRRGGPLIIAT